MTASICRKRGRVEFFMHGELMYNITHPTAQQDQFILDAAVKVEGGVRFLCESRADRPNAALILYRCNTYGEFSARPYHLGQAADDSTLQCVLALYYDFCRRNSLNPTKLMLRAYPQGERAEDWDALAWRTALDAAHWHDTRFPQAWTPDAILGLLISLRSQHRTHLAAILAEQLNLPNTAKGQGAD
jgi:hypothetical protein